nr:hypothetical protein [Tanacetum cinerariifolium]
MFSEASCGSNMVKVGYKLGLLSNNDIAHSTAKQGASVPELDINIVQGTNPVDRPAKERHIPAYKVPHPADILIAVKMGGDDPLNPLDDRLGASENALADGYASANRKVHGNNKGTNTSHPQMEKRYNQKVMAFSILAAKAFNAQSANTQP